MDPDVKERDRKPGLGLRQMLGSVLAAAFGVQSKENRERDFAHGSVHKFAVLGILATLVFVLVVFSVVKLVLLAAKS
jgi:hypothetical protein